MNWTNPAFDQAAVAHVAAASEWWWCGRNYSTLEGSVILLKSIANDGEFANAGMVLNQLGVTTETLVECFGEPRLRHDNAAGWQALANKVGRTIHLCIGHGEPTAEEVGVYRPSWWHRLWRWLDW